MEQANFVAQETTTVIRRGQRVTDDGETYRQFGLDGGGWAEDEGEEDEKEQWNEFFSRKGELCECDGCVVVLVGEEVE